MKRWILSLGLCCLLGCSSSQQAVDDSIPQLLMRTPLPPVPATVVSTHFEMDMVLYILDDGTVEHVKLRKASGDPDWDSAAVASILKWRFSPARIDDNPISTWYRIKTTVRYANPRYCCLAEIVCSTSEKADSVYAALVRGEDFAVLAQKYSVAPSKEKNGMLGEIDVNLFPESICKVLRGLDKGDFSKPVKHGDKYVIFKKIKN